MEQVIAETKYELGLLYELKGYIETEAFQKYIVKPMKDKREQLKYSYDCETLKDIYRNKGRKEILDYFDGILKSVKQEIGAKEELLKAYTN